MSMRVQVQLRIVAQDESVISDDAELLLLDKSDDRLEALGLSLAEAKALLASVQQRLVTAQAASYAARRWCSEIGLGAIVLSATFGYAMRTEFGRPASIMRLRTATPRAASAC